MQVNKPPPASVIPPGYNLISLQNISPSLTGGVYKARVHIHRGVLIRDYKEFPLHAIKLQITIRTSTGLKVRSGLRRCLSL